MQTRLFSLLLILTLAAGCAPGSYATRPASEEASQEETTLQWRKNAETEEEYQQRIWWENMETEWPRLFRRRP